MEKDRTETDDIWTRRYEEEEADDLFREEEDPEDEHPMLKAKQENVANEGMLQVRTQDDWSEKVLQHLGLDNSRPLTTNLRTILDEIEKVGKATCYVRRKRNSRGREDYHRTLKDDGRLSAEVRRYHVEKYQKVLDGKGGSGTGFLISPKQRNYHWLVLTNNHVIMDEDEANGALVVFDYLHDNSSRGSKTFFVADFVCSSLRTESAEDHSTLDYSLLSLKYDVSDNEFLEQHAMLFEETVRVQWGCQKDSAMLAFSHPHGLSKRISLGYFDTDLEEYPVKHIRHSLPTTTGSSGANICIPDVASGPEKYKTWLSAFVHYRASQAVGWQAIGNHLRSETRNNPKWNASRGSANPNPSNQ